MLNFIREKFGASVIGLIIGFIAFVFIFSGVANPSKTKGLHEGAVAGTVNGEAITLQEFSRAFNQRLEFYKQISGGKMTEAQLKAARLREGVLQELVTQKLNGQAAQKAGVVGSDEEVRERIRAYPAFQKDGRFDTATYKMVLKANNYTPGTFEKLIREEVTQAAWQNYFRNRVRSSELEIKQEFLLSNDKRNIKYVLLTTETGRRGVKVPQSEVQAFLKDPAKLAGAKSQFELRKEKEYKGQKFEAVQARIAEELIAAEKSDEIGKVNEKLAEQLVSMLKSGKASDAQVNALLKPYGAEIKQTGMITRLTPYLPGIGEAQELLKDAFSPKAPIEGKARKYSSGAWTMVALVSESEKADLSKLAEQREQIVRQLAFRKERALQDGFMRKLRERAKIETNQAVLDASEG